MDDVRAALWQSGQELDVETNQRALIDKVLARYAGDFACHRELLQNADDARATTVEFRFTSAAARADGESLPDLSSHQVSAMTARNDGFVFRDEDWSRLRSIASGNPDESKIGAFGLGYYTVFSICDEPLVTSGARSMLFFFKGDKLMVRVGSSPGKDDEKPWTTFSLPYREPGTMPEPQAFCRFLAASFAFTNNLRSLRLFLDDTLLCSLDKQLAPPTALARPSTLQTSSPGGFLRLTAAESTQVQIDARVIGAVLLTKTAKDAATSAASSSMSFAARMLAGAFGRTTAADDVAAAVAAAPRQDPMAFIEARYFLRVLAGHLAVKVPPRYLADIERATKKKPPATTRISLTFASKDELDASLSTASNQQARSIFENLASSLDVQGRIAIGFLTQQTTGCNASLAAAFIPTVERESLDLQHPATTAYNRELLWACGILARTVYEAEMTDVARLWKQVGDEQSARDLLTARAVHAARFFTFSASTPSSIIASDVEDAFMTADRSQSLTVISTQGPRASKAVRLPRSEMTSFIKTTPIVPLSAATELDSLLYKLRGRHMLSEITLDDVCAELQSRTLDLTEMRAFLGWAIALASDRAYLTELRSRLLSAAILQVPADAKLGQEPRPLPLGAVRTYLNTQFIAPDLPLPLDTLPHAISRSLRPADLGTVFGWTPLSLPQLLRHLVSSEMTGATASSPTNMLSSPAFAEKVLLTLTKAWSSLSTSQQSEVVALLGDKAFIPTRHGLREPGKSYLPTVKLFESLSDLAVVEMPSGSAVRGSFLNVLVALGVRKHVELQLVFTRLLGGGKMSANELIRYLTTVELSGGELDKLKKTAFLSKEGVEAADPSTQPTRYRASQLYEPSDAMRELGLGVLAWDGRWRTTSDEAKLMYSLGLNRTPLLQELLSIAADPTDDVRRRAALTYFLNHFTSYASSYQPASHSMAFVPSIKADGSRGLSAPLEVSSNPTCRVMGFATLDTEYAIHAPKFRLRDSPSAADLLKRLLESPPLDAQSAGRVFGYLATQLSSFGPTQLGLLSSSKILPVANEAGQIELKPPSSCFLGRGETVQGVHSLFTILPHYSVAARPFLLAIGVKPEPTPTELAALVLQDPGRVYALAGSADKYLQVLRTIAASMQSLSSSVKRQMRSSAFFLASTATSDASDKEDDLDNAQPVRWVLCVPGEVVVIDDVTMHASFASSVLACPQEDLLESFAEELGAARLSKLVVDSYHSSGTVTLSTPRTAQMHALVLERSELFLYERTRNRKDIAHDSAWLKKHLEVADVGKLDLRRTLKKPNDAASTGINGTKTVTRVASAACSMQNGRLRLVLAQNIEVDMYEVADGISRYLLKRQRVDDALLLMTLLSTNLKILQRRGYNVNRILDARRIEREAQEQRQREAKLAEQVELANRPASIAAPSPPQITAQAREAVQPEQRRISSSGSRSEADAVPPVSRNTGLLSAFRKKLGNKSGDATALPFVPSGEASNATSIPAGPSDPRRPPSSRPALPDPDSQVSPANDIKNNVLRAIAASRPDNDPQVRSLPSMREVSEPASSYCDASHATDLVYTSSVDGLRYYTARDADAGRVLEQHGAPLRRFARIVREIGDVFGVNPASLHLFWDNAGPLIAFNRSGALYLNLRYYVGWHDEAVQTGNRADAYISWYMSLAHELAHNLVEPHNSEHEFYFSSLAEQYFEGLAGLLARSKPIAGTSSVAA